MKNGKGERGVEEKRSVWTKLESKGRENKRTQEKRQKEKEQKKTRKKREETESRTQGHWKKKTCVCLSEEKEKCKP